MFQGLSNNQKEMVFSAKDFFYDDSEDSHYEEVDDNYNMLEDGIFLDESIVDEYDDFEDEMESDIPEPLDSDNIYNSNIIDEEEAEHYDSLEDDE